MEHSLDSVPHVTVYNLVHVQANYSGEVNAIYKIHVITLYDAEQYLQV